MKKIVVGREHIGKWVALEEDKKTVIASSDNLVDLYEQVGSEYAIYTKVLDPDETYAF